LKSYRVSIGSIAICVKEGTAMKVYKGIVKGNTVILEEKPDLPDECPALVEIKPLDQARDEEISRRQIALLRNPHKGGKLLYRRREELYDRKVT
jgi:hypothetical protein